MTKQFTQRELTIIADVCNNLPAQDYLDGFRAGYRQVNPFEIYFSNGGFDYVLFVREVDGNRLIGADRIHQSEYDNQESEDDEPLWSVLVKPRPDFWFEWVLSEVFVDAARQSILESVVHTAAKHPNVSEADLDAFVTQFE